MVILLLVEFLKVGGVIALTVSSHLVPHLSLLPCLKKKTHTDVHITHTFLSLNFGVPLINTSIWVTRTHTYPHCQNLNDSLSVWVLMHTHKHGAQVQPLVSDHM